jgi:hypothetical protein
MKYFNYLMIIKESAFVGAVDLANKIREDPLFEIKQVLFVYDLSML